MGRCSCRGAVRSAFRQHVRALNGLSIGVLSERQGDARGVGAGKRKDAEQEGRESERGQGRVVKGAWEGAGFSDDMYVAEGASIVSAADVWEGAGFSDEMYVAEGASIVSAADVWKDDVVVAINDPGAETAGKRWKTARS